MTARFPLVMVSGLQQELPAGDYEADPVLAALTQLVDKGGDLVEVEATTKAMRIVVRPNSGGPYSEQAFSIGHYQVGKQGSFSATTTWTVDSEVAAGLNGFAGLCVLRKVEVSMATSAVVGTRAGTGRIMVCETKPAYGLSTIGAIIVPPVGGVSFSSANYQTLRSDQATSVIQIEYGGTSGNPNGSLGGTFLANQLKPLANHDFGVKSAVGNDLPPTLIFDDRVHGPYIMGTFEGFYVGATYPQAGTSQSVQYAFNITWDEWTPVPLGAL